MRAECRDQNTFDDGRVVEAGKEQEGAVLALGKVGELLLAPVEPLVVAVGSEAGRSQGRHDR